MITASETHLREPVSTSYEYERTIAWVDSLLARFEPISLAELEHVKLLNRTDTKYIMRLSQLERALQMIAGQYRVLSVNGTRLNHYQNLYFDTHDFALYRQHHNGLRVRYKVRIREYVESDLVFWEVKRKTNQNHTVKYRLQTPTIASVMDSRADQLVTAHTPLKWCQLEPKLWNRFARMTLASKDDHERLTLDVNLEFAWGDACAALPGIAIAEVKQAHFSSHSSFMRAIRELGIQPTRFSKYCAGVCLLYDNVKSNNFKTRMRLVERLMQEEWADGYAR